MLYHLGATAIALLHLAFILFVVGGGFFVLRYPRLAWLHVPAAIWGVMIEFGGWVCPLTYAENALRRKAGLAGYSDGFVSHYVFPLIYPAGLTRGTELAIGVGVLLLNLGIYVRVFK